MTYQEKLKQQEWRDLRLVIFSKDKFICQVCKRFCVTRFVKLTGRGEGDDYVEFDEPIIAPEEDAIFLNLHHKCYRIGREPWDYDWDELLTVCPECHEQIHKRIKIPVLNKRDECVSYAETCDRCNGKGFIPEYNHVQNGICFKCEGEGVFVDNL